MPASGFGRKVLGFAGPVLLGLLVGAIGVELLARWSWEDAWRDPEDTGAPADAGELGHVEGILELAKPHLRVLHRNVYHRTNSRGVRGPEYPAKPRPGVFRILVTGDSTTMGSGVLEQERYTQRLEERLGAGYEVVNIGLSGLNIRGAIDRLTRHSKHYHSRLFVYGFSSNDIEGPHYRTPPMAVPPAEFGRFYWSMIRSAETSRSYFLRYLIQWGLTRGAAGGQNHVLVENFLDNPRAWQAFTRGLDRFAQLSRARGVCGHVLIHPQFQQFDETHPFLPIYERVAKAALERGLSVTQPFDHFVEHAPKRAKALWVSLFDPHPNRRGHELLADALHDDLRALPAECWTLE